MGRFDRAGADETRVFSTDSGRVRPTAEPRPRTPPRGTPTPPVGDDGAVRVSRTKSGRGGKTVTLVTGLPAADRAAVLTELKRRCGCGGAIKDEVVEIQGDQRDRIVAALDDRYRVIRAGG